MNTIMKNQYKSIKNALLSMLAGAMMCATSLTMTSCGTSGSNFMPILGGLEYPIGDSPVTLVVKSTAKGYDWDFKVEEGKLSDWLEVLPDGAYLVTAPDGSQLHIVRGEDDRPIITIRARKRAPKPIVATK